ncbi:polysaccharide biosynthesis protein, partial [Acinetobacter baumannii]|nr:polysaccharide biosynthesis protein [Acinetobacter baumannii]
EGSVDGDIAIEYVGLRPGEKLYEELLIGNSPSPSGHARILRANEPFINWNILRDEIAELQQMIECGEPEAARELLLKLVVEFSPTSPLVD